MGFRRVLQDFINDTFHLSAQHCSPRSSPSHKSTLHNRFVSLFRARHPKPEVVEVPTSRCFRRMRPGDEILSRKDPIASSSRPPNSTITQQSSGAAQIQPSSQPQIAVPIFTAPPVVADTPSNTNPHTTIKHAGRWARCRHFI
ncbi:hypothetical protein BDR04DRAFT_590282 [Suillus decipiens]|nr:hypothetical protein BDR04DRAFT_590282 [Suillus decipiens]